jgi:predicted ATPase
MMRSFRIERFKRFRRLELPLGKLTVLAGLNSAGKTTSVHAMLLYRLAQGDNPVVELNGPFGLSLGEPLDVLHHGSSEETIVLTAESEDGSHEVTLEIPEDRALHLINRRQVPAQPPALALAQSEPTFTYLCAERHGPRDALPVESRSPGDLGVGVYGQHTAQVLDQHRRQEVPEGRRAPPEKGEQQMGAMRFLERQSERWLSLILGVEGTIRLEARWVDGANITTLRYQMPGRGIQAGWTRPQNVGFGTSYVLPIVVAALQAPRGGLLIVENPEAHLHPAGQSMMGAFLAQVASDGVQVIVETHSDHVLNGIRRSVSLGESVLEPESVKVLFFGANRDDSAFEELALKRTGELSAWPRGFFDQIERDLGAMARARRRRRH